MYEAQAVLSAGSLRAPDKGDVLKPLFFRDSFSQARDPSPVSAPSNHPNMEIMTRV